MTAATDVVSPIAARTADWRGPVWIAWRQHRAVVGGTLLWALVLGAAAVWTTVRLDAVATCEPACSSADRDAVTSLVHAGEVIIPLVAALPAVLALFWAAPMLAREYEQRTHLLAWTQDLTPRRWLAAKALFLAAAAVPVVLVAGVPTARLADRMGSVNPSGNNGFEAGSFDAAPAMLLAHAATALAIGLAASALLRRTVAAMAATVVLCGLLWGAAVLARPHLLDPQSVQVPFTGYGESEPEQLTGAWVLDWLPVDATGTVLPAYQGEPAMIRYLYLGAERLTELRLWEAGLSLAVAALALPAVIYGMARVRSAP
ncbi:ABC transporter permease subunit [Streptomyces sp. bgisy060]|uniref:ABC transporter permease subunit n=1 Tax=Streptomyces sp. bgisy060 TaxID=3413775 RepID=UPI003EBB2F8A